jgi:ATP-dependent exoDNAse (exonuclease V) beta subunit
MKHFNHVEAPTLTELIAETTGSGRVYNTPEGNRYPSVTTILSELSKAGIAAWRKRVGAEEANRISTQASTRGTKIHQICEDYLNNKPDYLDGQMPANVFTFKQIQPILDQYVDNIQYLEAPLYSDFLKTAGRVDCIAEFDGKLSIIDFKTSRKPKKKEWISNYFMQASCYAVMYEERTEIPVSRTVVIVAVDGSEPQVFVENRDNFIEEFVDARVSYKEKYNV